MKIAYLIAAYRDPKHLARLIDALGENADFYVHIDKKVDITPFKQALRGRKNVRIISFGERVFVCWAGYSQVDAISAMMKNALESGIRYDRIANITGMDYPLWSNQEIAEEFSSHPDKEYLIGFNITQSSSESQKDKVRKYWFYDYRLGNNFTIKCCAKIMNWYSTHLPLRKKVHAPIGGKGCDVYFGSDYWALTYNCAKHVYETISTQKELQRYFRHSFAPSELFVETIVFNSGFGKQATLYPSREYKNLAALTPLHYIDFISNFFISNGIKVFDESDYDELANSGKMFFRKAASGKSDRLLDRIDACRSTG